MPSASSSFRRIVSWLGLSALLALPSCASNSGSSSSNDLPKNETPSSGDDALLLLGAMLLDPATCVAKPDATAKMIAGGTLDLAFRTIYTAFLLVEKRASSADMAAETERIVLDRADIKLTTLDGVVLSQYPNVALGVFNAATSADSYGLVTLDLIPSEVGKSERLFNAQQVLAKVRVSGTTANGKKMTSTELAFPIRVCTGCLVEYPAIDADPAWSETGYHCSSVRRVMPPCVIGQDVSFPCSACAAALEVCGDPKLNPSFSP